MIKSDTRWVALMIQLEKFVGWWGGCVWWVVVVGKWGVWLTASTFIQLAGDGSKSFLKRYKRG